MRMRRTFYAALVYGTLSLGAVSFLLPLFWMISTALKADFQIFAYPPQWMPNPVVWENFKRAIDYFPFWLYARNTMIITVSVVVGQVVTAALVAYGFAKIEWPGRDVVFVFVLATMMLPSQVTMIPLFVLFQRMGWINTWRLSSYPAGLGGPSTSSCSGSISAPYPMSSPQQPGLMGVLRRDLRPDYLPLS